MLHTLSTHSLQTPKQISNIILYNWLALLTFYSNRWQFFLKYSSPRKRHVFLLVTTKAFIVSPAGCSKFHRPPPNTGRVLVNVPFISSQQKNVSFVSPYPLNLISANVSNSKIKTKASQKQPIPSSGFSSSTSELGDKRKNVLSWRTSKAYRTSNMQSEGHW